MRSLRYAAASLIAVVGVSIVLTACSKPAEDSAQSSDPQVAAGQKLVQGSCLGCHSTDGSTRTGPTFKGLAGSQVKLTSGQTVTADDAYLARAIENPDAEITQGFPKGVMARSVRPGSVTPEEAAQMVAYLKTVK